MSNDSSGKPALPHCVHDVRGEVARFRNLPDAHTFAKEHSAANPGMSAWVGSERWTRSTNAQYSNGARVRG